MNINYDEEEKAAGETIWDAVEKKVAEILESALPGLEVDNGMLTFHGHVLAEEECGKLRVKAGKFMLVDEDNTGEQCIAELECGTVPVLNAKKIQTQGVAVCGKDLGLIDAALHLKVSGTDAPVVSDGSGTYRLGL